jgi:hypothetical protein
MLAGRFLRVEVDFVIIVWHCLPSNAGKASQPDLGRTNDPDWLAALAPDIFPVRVHRVPKPLDHFGALRAGIRAQMKPYIVLQSDRSKACFHARVLEQNLKLGSLFNRGQGVALGSIAAELTEPAPVSSR